ncbi:MAG: heme-binding domain-containing protein, partial [Ginsengibacter sp.]
MKKKILLAILAILVVIQFIRPSRNLSTGVSDNDIAKHYTVPDNVQTLLKTACYDCHSNNTVYPWYTNIQPVGWWMQSHVDGGKEHLNFSEFTRLDGPRQYKKLGSLIKEIKGGGMPLDSYLWIHKDAKLSDNDKNTIIAWAQGLQHDVIMQY